MFSIRETRATYIQSSIEGAEGAMCHSLLSEHRKDCKKVVGSKSSRIRDSLDLDTGGPGNFLSCNISVRWHVLQGFTTRMLEFQVCDPRSLILAGICYSKLGTKLGPSVNGNLNLFIRFDFMRNGPATPSDISI